MSGTIMYRTSLSQLCDLDIITVLDSVGGEYRPGASCGMGHFFFAFFNWSFNVAISCSVIGLKEPRPQEAPGLYSPPTLSRTV
ncbi:MAG: hypothetical protein P8126_03375, partial [Gammaproteobacteria bacterium]